jgi:nickel transport protein
MRDECGRSRDEGQQARVKGQRPHLTIHPSSFILRPFLLAGLTALLGSRAAYAHRLDAQAFVLPDRRVQIESWFSSGEPARGAKVQVLRADGSPLVEGRLDEKGIFIFKPLTSEKLTVIVSAGMGHRKELTIAGDDLARALSSTSEKKEIESTSPDPVPLADRSPAYPIKDVLLGITFLLALAAFMMSVRNQRRLKRSGS